MRLLCRNESGMALLVVLTVVAVLLAAALELARTTGTAALATATVSDRYRAREKAMAGLHLAMALLMSDAEASEVDSVQEDWARADRLEAAVSALGMEGLTLEIVDELGKLQVNALIKEFPGNELNPDQFRVWDNFFTALTTDDNASEVLNCLQDWLDDRDDEAVTGVSGAESDHYLSLDTPYHCANGPFLHFSELFLVKGITPELFTPEEETEEAEEAETPLPPEQSITVHGLPATDSAGERYSFPGKVNINTAPAAVIRALLPADLAELAEDLVDYRGQKAEKDGEFTNRLDKGWVAQVIDLPADDGAEFNRVIRYDSDLFRINSRAEVNGARVIVSALTRRTKDKLSGKWSCRLLQINREG